MRHSIRSMTYFILWFLFDQSRMHVTNPFYIFYEVKITLIIGLAIPKELHRRNWIDIQFLQIEYIWHAVSSCQIDHHVTIDPRMISTVLQTNKQSTIIRTFLNVYFIAI